MLFPRFTGGSFWDSGATAEAVGARVLSPPLGLITVAAMLPDHWEVRFLDRNCAESAPADFAWADLVMTGGMLPQQDDTLAMIRLCRAHATPVVVGGPDVTSSPHVYEEADFKVIGEAELVIDDFIAAWESGARQGVFVAEKFKADVTRTPIPRFELLDFSHYVRIGVQFSRGCPFKCEFCDIIELYGRVPRAKTPEQMLAELEALHRLGYRGRVDFVDDNLVGNKKALRELLPRLVEWQREQGYPFEFSTEASVNIAEDDAVLALMNEANFTFFFVGIESPDSTTLAGMQKTQNTRRNLVESIHKIHAKGMWVTAGFILGFDDEKGSVAEPMVRFIEEAAIPICLVGLLYALPNTQLTRRLAGEGRLFVGHDVRPDVPVRIADQCVAGLNFETARPRREILADCVQVLERIYDPSAFFARVRRFARGLKPMVRLPRVEPGRTVEGVVQAALGATVAEVREVAGVIWILATRHPMLLIRFWRTVLECAWTNPAALKAVVSVIALYLHLGPFSRLVMQQLEQQIAEIDEGIWKAPVTIPPAPARIVALGTRP